MADGMPQPRPEAGPGEKGPAAGPEAGSREPPSGSGAPQHQPAPYEHATGQTEEEDAAGQRQHHRQAPARRVRHL